MIFSSSTEADRMVSGVNNSCVMFVKNCSLEWFTSSAFACSRLLRCKAFCISIR